ncbi:MAG: hypothetical protein AAF791_12075 [Bacteroidota bacterium]
MRLPPTFLPFTMSSDFAPDRDAPSLVSLVPWPAVLTLLGVAAVVLVPILGALFLAA